MSREKPESGAASGRILRVGLEATFEERTSKLLRSPPPKLHAYIGVIRVSSGGQPVTRLFDATPFSRVQFSTRVYIINDNDIYPPP